MNTQEEVMFKIWKKKIVKKDLEGIRVENKNKERSLNYMSQMICSKNANDLKEF